MAGTKAKEFKVVNKICALRDKYFWVYRDVMRELPIKLPSVFLLPKARKEDSAQQMRAKFKAGVKTNKQETFNTFF